MFFFSLINKFDKKCIFLLFRIFLLQDNKVKNGIVKIVNIFVLLKLTMMHFTFTSRLIYF